MSAVDQEPASAPSNTTPDLTKGILQRAAQVIGALLFYGLLLFLSSGRLDWTAAWIYLAISAAIIVINSTILFSTKNAALIAARGQMREDAKEWDKQLTGIAAVVMLIGLIVPGLDQRFGWSAPFPSGLPLFGFVALAAGYALTSWAMISNPFFETRVRIQSDRGQTVTTSGPYRFIRHPGYVGMVLQWLGTPLGLASWWGLIPGLGVILAFIVRTTLEDRTLQHELPGYSDYAKRVRSRLLPGVW
jgi:protein-S-isoprenylcysteine O-methyltransferase Ste14